MLKKNILVYSLLVSTTCASSLTFADPWRGDRDDRQRDWQQRAPQSDQYRRPVARYDDRDRYRGDRDRDRDRGPVYYNQSYDRRYYHQPSYGHNNRWQRGSYVPRDYWGPSYRVNNWRGRGLPPPPQGHRWLNVNGQYILIAATTGIITSILLHQ